VNNIYIYGITSANGGIESIMKYLVFYLVDKNPKLHINIIAPYQEIAHEKEFVEKGANIIKIPSISQKKSYKKELNKVVTGIDKDDLFYVNVASYCNFYLFDAIKKAKCKIIIHGHNAYMNNIPKRIVHNLNRFRYRKYGYKIAVSEECNKFMFKNRTNAIVYNGIESKNYKFSIKDRLSARKEWDIKENDLVIGCLGRISKEKNQSYLVEYAKKNPEILFVFIGGFMNTKLETKIKRTAPKNCVFIGQCDADRVGHYLSMLDTLVIPSKHEGFPLAAVEALTNGLPVFYNEKLYKKLPKILKNDINSYCLSEAKFDVSFLLKQNELRNKSKVDFVDKYDINHFLKKLEGLIDEL